MTITIGNQRFDWVSGNFVGARYLHEGGKRYQWNAFMEYWEDSNYKFYRFATDQEIEDRKQVPKLYSQAWGDDDYLPF